MANKNIKDNLSATHPKCLFSPVVAHSESELNRAQIINDGPFALYKPTKPFAIGQNLHHLVAATA